MVTFEIILMVIKCVIAVAIAVFLVALLRQDLKKKMRESYMRIRGRQMEKVSANPEKKFTNDVMEADMLAHGIKFRMGANFSPFDYVVFRLVIGVGLGIVAMFFNPLFFPIGLIAGMVGIPMYFKQENENDNEDMLPDIAQMNGLVALQVKNGVFISKVIYSCYHTVKNERLKQALLELSIDMENFATIKEAATRFREKFTNPYIDTFAKTLEQVQDTGSSVAFFEDIQSSVEGINAAIAIKQEAAAEKTASIFQVMLFMGPIILVFYIMLGMLNGGGIF